MSSEEAEVLDVWLSPLDSRRSEHSCKQKFLNCLLGSCGVASLLLGGYVMLTEDWAPESSSKPPWIRNLVICNMLLEALVWGFTALSAGLVYATLGRNALVHALSVLSIMSDALLHLVYACCSIWGFLAIHWIYQENHYDLTGVPLKVYIIASWVAATGHAVSRIPTVIGTCAFALHHVERKLKHTPIVKFYTQYNRGDEYYIRVMPLEECSELVETMHNPLRIGMTAV